MAEQDFNIIRRKILWKEKRSFSLWVFSLRDLQILSENVHVSKQT